MGGVINYFSTVLKKYTDVSNDYPLPAQIVGNSTVAHSVASVAVTTTVALAANTNRKYALLINDSDTVIYLKIGGDGELNKGIRLNANGGSYELSNSLGNLDTRAINAIHGGAGTKTLLVTEGV